MAPENQHVAIEGLVHQLVPIDALENLAFRNGAEVTYPESTGWATARVGVDWWAAWFPGPSLREPSAIGGGL